MQTILIVDDNEDALDTMSDVLNSQEYEIVSTSSGKEALSLMQDKLFDVILTDMVIPDVDGMDILKAAQDLEIQPQVIMITAFGSIDKAVEAMRAGATDFIQKPVNNIGELREKVRKAIENQNLRRQNIDLMRQNVALQRQINEKFGFSSIIGNSKEMHEIFEQLRLVAPTKSNVLICGETGTGKDLIAQAIHNNSPRKNKPFIPINCAAISSSLLESELFGHERGAFTGAIKQRQGAFELANGGTLLLDEIGEMDPEIQAKFLRVIETQEFRRLGAEKPIKVDARIISATNKDLSEEVREGKFREDLYYRIKVITINVPPLRERKTDIPLLVKTFLQEFNQENDKSISSIQREAMDKLVNYTWHGNIRELRNTIESMVVMATSNTLSLSDLPINIRGAEVSQPIPIVQTGMTMEDIEREAIKKALEETNYNKTKAAKILNIGLRTLQRKIKKYNLS